MKFIHERTGFPLDGEARPGGVPEVPRGRLQGAARARLLGLPPRRPRRIRGRPVRLLPRHRGVEVAVRRRRPPAHQLPAAGAPRAAPLRAVPRRPPRPGLRPPHRAPAGSATRPTSRTPAARGTDHSARSPGYPQLACLGCHGFWRWSPATFGGHGVCFPIDSGNHAGITCAQLPRDAAAAARRSDPARACRIPPAPAATPARPSSRSTTACPGFSCVNLDQRCYECHPRGTASDAGGNSIRWLRKVKP